MREAAEVCTSGDVEYLAERNPDNPDMGANISAEPSERPLARRRSSTAVY